MKRPQSAEVLGTESGWLTFVEPAGVSSLDLKKDMPLITSVVQTKHKTAQNNISCILGCSVLEQAGKAADTACSESASG